MKKTKMNKKEVETILKINGFTGETPDDQIKTVLLSARYSLEEVDAALTILKQVPNACESKVAGLHRVFYTDKKLKPEEISNLLGIDINLESPISPRSRKSAFSLLQFILVWFFSVFFAISVILFYMSLI